MKLERTQEAIDAYQAALKADAKYAPASSKLAELYGKLKKMPVTGGPPVAICPAKL